MKKSLERDRSMMLGNRPKVFMASKTVGLGLFQKYHNTLRCPSKILHKHCFQFLLGLRPIVAHSSLFLVLVTTEKSVANSYKEREIGREIVKHTTIKS